MLNNSPSAYRKFDKSSSHKVQPARSQLVINLRKLVDSMELDLLAASLGIRESMLRDILSGKDNGDDYRQFLAQKLDEAGFSHNWLDRVNAQVFPDQIKELRNLASNSNQKAPLRRDNLKILMNAFDGKLDVLADALEVVPNALFKVSQGELMMDDQRFGHFNPILMRAGFPDGWLESAQAHLEPNYIDELSRMANDQYEEYLSKLEDAPVSSKAAPIQLSVSSPVVLSNPLPLEENSRMVTTMHPSTTATGVLLGKAPPPAFKAKTASPALTSIVEIVSDSIKENKDQAPNKSSSEKKEPLTVPPVILKKMEETAISAAPANPTGISAARTERLENLMKQARRGARSHLWLTCLNKSMALSYNLESGKAEFTDELANQVTHALGLPQGWLDQENGDPKLAAAWVWDKTISLKPASAPQQETKISTSDVSTLPPPVKKISQLKTDAKDASKPALNESESTGVKLLTSISENQLSSTRGRIRLKASPEKMSPTPEYTEKKEPAAANINLSPLFPRSLEVPAKEQQTAEIATPQVIAAEVAGPVAVPQVVAAEVAVPQVVLASPVAIAAPAAPPAKPTLPALELRNNAAVLGEIGPLAKALLHTIELQARLGKLSEQQALEIIYKIS